MFGCQIVFECQKLKLKRELRISNAKFASIEELVTVPNVTAMTEGKRMRVGPRQKTKGDAGFTAISRGSVAFKINARIDIRIGVNASHVARSDHPSGFINNFIEGAADATPGALLVLNRSRCLKETKHK